jgi:hypothetical protein
MWQNLVHLVNYKISNPQLPVLGIAGILIISFLYKCLRKKHEPSKTIQEP